MVPPSEKGLSVGGVDVGIQRLIRVYGYVAKRPAEHRAFALRRANTHPIRGSGSAARSALTLCADARRRQNPGHGQDQIILGA